MCRSRRDFRELIDVGLAGGEQRSDDETASVGEQPAVRAADFFEQTVRPQQCQLARDLGCLLALLRRGAVGRIQQSAQIAVAQAGRRELPRLTTSKSAASSLAQGVKRAVTLAVHRRT
jgi:hypothetical protein